MSKLDEKIAFYQNEMKNLGLDCEIDLLRAITKGLGPSIHKVDAETVSGSDQNELATVKNNFLIKKLEMSDGPALDNAISKVVDKMGRSNRKKYRAIFYYLLVEEFGLESNY